jgi:hypothetical protein
MAVRSQRTSFSQRKSGKRPRFYQRYLANSIPDSDEYKIVAYRLKRLQAR